MGLSPVAEYGPQLEELPDRGIGPANPPSWADDSEIDTFNRFVEEFWAGRVDPDEFKRFRLQHGVYGQRQQDVQMVRVKIPWGGLTAAQLERLADIADKTPRGVGHVTTRQNMQFHFVPLVEVPALLRSLAEAGLTTREACGNTVRNVTVGQCAGICPKEPFDPTPYADAVTRFLLRNPMNQNLPRKFKIAFSGCDDDTGLTPIHDIGARAAVRTAEGSSARGFEILLGGGLGAAPRLAQPLEEFTAVQDLLPTVAAIVRVFDRHGNRENRNLARLKFVVQKLGIDQLRALILRERDGLRLTMAGKFPVALPWEERVPIPRARRRGASPGADPAYRRWSRTNVVPQKQPGYAAVHVRLLRGDMTSAQFRALARAAREFGDGAVRSTNQQNFLLRWIPADALPELHAVLAGAGLALAGAERLIDITACPGADTCQLGITSSRGLAFAIGQVIEQELGELADEAGIRIKISGCPNSCGQHHLASLGFYGGAKKFHGEQAPTYQLLLGGRLEPGNPSFAKPVARIPAKQVPQAVKTLLELYRRERTAGESFNAFVDRAGLERMKAVLAPWTEVPPSAEAPDNYLDWGAEEGFKLETGPGECAA
ncbi:MAG: nitrite/sulfite reductase [Candidatus Methylomirabilia bacterium]